MNDEPLKLIIARRRSHIEQGGDLYWTGILPDGNEFPMSWPNSIAAFQGVRRWFKRWNCEVQINF